MDITDLKIGRDATFLPPLKSNLNTIKAYEKDGYDSLFFADHIMNWIPKSIWTPDITNLASVYESPHLIYEAFTMMSIASLNTRKVKLGTGVTETFRRHPAVLAQTILTLDQLSNGRTILGIGTGEKENIIPYGIKWDNPVSRLEEAIKIIRLLWENDEKFDYNGKFWNLKNAIFSLKPHKAGRYPPIWLVAHGPRMLDITGRLVKTINPGTSDNDGSSGKAEWDGKNENGTEIAMGIYLYSIIDEEGHKKSGKICVVK